MSTLFGYYELGLRALSAAQLGLQVAGNNISNVNTPGYSRRRVELATGYPVQVKGGMLDQGVDIQRIGRLADRFLQNSLEREKGSLAGSKESLRGLQDIESLFGTLESDGILSFYASFADRFAELSGQPENVSLRRVSVSSADTLARQIRETYARLQTQRQSENETIKAAVDEVNQLARSLASLNREILSAEADGSVAAPLRDERDSVIERLAELTGGTAVQGEGGKLLFSLSGGPTLVTGENAVLFSTSTDAEGMARISSSGFDLTDKLRGGELGALIGLRDDELAQRMGDLDSLAGDLISRVNALTSGAVDLDGNPGGPLFVPDPPTASGVAGTIAVAADVLADPRRLAVSASGAPGDGSVALEISELRESASAALGGRSPATFLADMLSGVGNRILQADVATTVAAGLVENFQSRRDAISGVSLDEEAVELLRNQRAYEAAARFMQILNEVTEVTLSIGR